MAYGSERRPKVLIIGDESGAERFLSTFLSSMGCSCTAASSVEALVDAAGREAFDVALVDLRFSALPAEKFTSVIEKIPPSLFQRTLVLSKDHPDEGALRLIEGYGVPRISQNRLLPTLWDTIQKVVAGPLFENLDPQGLHTAQMVSDSFRQPAPAGFRRTSSARRHLVFSHQNMSVDISIEHTTKPGHVSLVGQAVDVESGRGISGSQPVLLNSRTGTLARNVTNPNGEFSFECELARGMELEIRTDQGKWVRIPLPELKGAEGPHMERAAG